MQKLLQKLKDNLTREYIANTVLVVFIYFVAGKLGLQLAFFNPSATSVWPPTGIAIALFLFTGYKYTPSILLGAFLVNITTTGNPYTSFLIAIGNTLEAVVASYLSIKFTGVVNPFHKPVNIFIYTFVAAFMGVIVSATFGVTTLALFGNVLFTDFWRVWVTWLLGDMGGAIIIAPLIILLKDNPRFSLSVEQWKELFAISLFLFLALILVFGRVVPATIVDYSLAFICVPVLVWIAFRFSPRETIIAIFLVATVAISATLTGYGPFVRAGPDFSLVILQVFMGIVFLAVMPLSAAIAREREIEHRYATLVDTSPDAVIVIDLKGTITFLNNQALKLYGISKKEDILGTDGFKLVAEESLDITKKGLADVTSKGRIASLEYISKRPDGSKFFTSANASLIKDASGVPWGVIVVVHDITREKELDSAKNDFFALAAHQLRTPLSVMRWNLEILLSGKTGVPESAIKKIKAARDSTQKLILLVNSLLDVSMIEQGVLPNKPEEVDVSKIVRKIIEEMQLRATQKSTKLVFKSTGTAKTFYIDPQRFREVVYNLIDNAIKYSDDGEVNVAIDNNEKELLLSVTDSGVGIPTRDADKIFGKYFRGENAKELDKEGVGMGLFMIKSFTESIGGKAWFESPGIAGKGTTFYIQVPRKGKHE